MIKLIARVVGTHKLHLPAFYTFVVRYLQPHQEDVLGILVSVAQATHELAAPDDVEAVVKIIADRFVVDTVSSEVISAGYLYAI